jgi:predicted Fe-S protein YdhL (DUF1289 family)
MSTAEQLGPALAPVPTPCIGVCELDEASGLCKGCARTGEEVAAWQEAGADFKLRVWGELPPRRIAAGMNAYRLPWSADDIAAMIERTLRRRWGRWVLGAPGASASFEIGADEDSDVFSRADCVEAVTARGALRLLKHKKAIAVAFGEKPDECGPDAIGLILPRGRVDLPVADSFTCCGTDVAAICGTYRDAGLYDVGLGRYRASRFCLRTDDPALSTLFANGEKQPGLEVIDAADAAIDEARVHSIVETGLGRLEVFSQPLSGCAGGTCAELRSAGADIAAELPLGWTLPQVFAPCALFFPHSRRTTGALLDGHF